MLHTVKAEGYNGTSLLKQVNWTHPVGTVLICDVSGAARCHTF